MRTILSLLMAGSLSVLFAAEEGANSQDAVLAAARAADAFYQRKVETLLTDLTNEDVEKRIAAIRHIGYLQDPALSGNLLPFLHPTKNTPEEIIITITSLTDSGCLVATNDLKKLLKHEDPRVRANAMNALTRVQMIDRAEYLARDSDPETAIRASSETNLGLLKAEEAAPILLKNLALDPSPHVRRMCAIALGQLGIRENGPALADALADANPGVRRYAAEALVKIEYTPAIPHLLMALEANVAGDHIARCLRMLTKQDFGFDTHANSIARAEAIEKGFKWWSENAKDLDR